MTDGLVTQFVQAWRRVCANELSIEREILDKGFLCKKSLTKAMQLVLVELNGKANPTTIKQLIEMELSI